MLCLMNKYKPTAEYGAAESELHAASWAGDLELVVELVSAGADPMAKDNAGRLPIDVAHESGKGDRVAYLKTVGPPIRSKRKKA